MTMSRIALLMSLAVLAASPASAQVEVTQLAAPDAFTAPGRETGLGPDLWRGTPVELARTVLPLVESKPLSPAAAAMARRVLATGAAGPEGSIGDEALAGARAKALLALGDVPAASRILDRARGLERNSDLAQAAAESALLVGDPARACSIAEALTVGRADIYWLRLRAYCQAEAGLGDAAQLTFELAQALDRDAIYGRLMTAKRFGGPSGAASLRNGLDLVLSASLNLDLTTAKQGPGVAAALSGMAPAPPIYDVSGIDGDVGGLGESLRTGLPPEAGVSALIAVAAEADPKTRGRLQGAALLLAALSKDLPGPDRVSIATFAVPEGKSSAGRNMALEAASDAGRMGETALLALWISADAGASGPALADRVRIVRALSRAGLVEEARLYALEGLAELK